MRDDFDRRNDARDGGMGSMMLGILAALAVAAALYFWAPWNGPRTADNTSRTTTVGSATTRPAVPPAPTAPAPAAR